MNIWREINQYGLCEKNGSRRSKPAQSETPAKNKQSYKNVDQM